MPSFEPRGFKKTKPAEFLVRFAYGGFVTLCTGLLGKAFGPVAGGFLLSFPAILPATLTLVREHDGRKEAVEDARGARLGSAGLMAFAVTAWFAATSASPVLVLLGALLAWIVVNAACWALSS